MGSLPLSPGSSYPSSSPRRCPTQPCWCPAPMPLAVTTLVQPTLSIRSLSARVSTGSQLRLSHTHSPLRIIGSQHGCLGRDLKDLKAQSLLWAGSPPAQAAQDHLWPRALQGWDAHSSGQQCHDLSHIAGGPPTCQAPFAPSEAVLAVPVLHVP